MWRIDPLISEDLFYRVQSILSGRAPSMARRQRAHPDFPLRGFVCCESCGRGLTVSSSKGRSEYYAYYHCRSGCRAVNVKKASAQMSLGERDPRPRLQVRLERYGASLVAELDDNVCFPWSSCCSVRAVSVVVGGDTRSDIGRQACVVATWGPLASENVNEPLRADHATHMSKRSADRELLEKSVMTGGRA